MSSTPKDDFFKLFYSSKTKSCTLYKNNKEVNISDTTPIRNSYDCLALKQENYNSCMQYDADNVSAVMLSYGKYKNTNTIMAFFATYKDKDAHLTIRCTHTLKDIFKK